MLELRFSGSESVRHHFVTVESPAAEFLSQDKKPPFREKRKAPFNVSLFWET